MTHWRAYELALCSLNTASFPWRGPVAYEVIKRVGGRAYRYRVESYRDPETRRVRGKWTYLGRVEGEGTLSPERQARPSSRTRLLNALEELLGMRDLPASSRITPVWRTARSIATSKMSITSFAKRCCATARRTISCATACRST